MARAKNKVLLLMGSQSDWAVMKHAVEELRELGVGCEAHVMSAHRTPSDVAGLVGGAEAAGFRVVIAAAGMAAHLAGVAAAHTTLPVIGVPLAGGTLDGLDALLSTVQMPKGVPVATVAVGKAGAINAAVLATQILALGDVALRRRLARFKADQAEAVRRADQALQQEMGHAS